MLHIAIFTIIERTTRESIFLIVRGVKASLTEVKAWWRIGEVT